MVSPSSHHFDDFGIDGLGQYAHSGCNVVDNLVETRSLDLFTLQVCHWVHEVEDIATLQQLPYEQVLLLTGSCICKQNRQQSFKLIRY